MPELKSKLVLYHAWPSRSSIVRWMLEEVGEPYEIVRLSLKDGDQRKPFYLAINPMGKVPALKDGETVITEVAAICCYLADAYPAAKLAPPIGDARRGPYLKWLFFGPSCLEPAMIDKTLGRLDAPRGTVGWGDYETVVDVLKHALTETPYLLGEQFTAADIVIGAGVRWGMKFKMLPDLPEFVAYAERLGERPALQRQVAADEAMTAKDGH